jgi:hypothetical protein
MGSVTVKNIYSPATRGVYRIEVVIMQMLARSVSHFVNVPGIISDPAEMVLLQIH